MRHSGRDTLKSSKTVRINDNVANPEALNEWDVIKHCLKDQDYIYFEIDTADLWLRVNFTFGIGNVEVVKGSAQFKVPKNATFGQLKKAIQLFGIKQWSRTNRENGYFDHDLSGGNGG